MVPILQTEPNEYQSRHDEWRRDVKRQQTGLGLEDTAVTAHIEIAEKVVKPMTRDLTNECSNNRREIKQPNLLQSKPIQRRHEDSQRSVDPDDPCKRQAIVEHAQKHSGLRDDDPRAHEGLPGGAALLPALPLLDTEHAQSARFGYGTRDHGKVAIVEGFVHKEEDEEEADAAHDGEEAEAPRPAGARKDESCEEGAEVWREDNEGGPDIDFAAVKKNSLVRVTGGKDSK